MAAFLLVAATILMLLPSITRCTDFDSFWKQQFPGTDIPSVLQTRKSPLTLPEADELHRLIVNESLPLQTANVCGRANLFCNKPARVIVMRQYGYGALGGYNYSDVDENRFFPFVHLQEGMQMKLPFIDDPVSKSAFLPHTVAEKLSPLSKDNLAKIKRRFQISEGSNMSRMMDFVVQWCGVKQDGDEAAKCSSSMEEMVEFVVKTMGKDVQCLSQPDVKEEEKIKIVKVNEVGLHQAYPVIPCHSLPFPVGIYYCHYLTHTRGFKVKVLSEMDGKETVRPVICHFPKTKDNFREVSKESTSAAAAACHFLPGSHIAWVPR